MAQPEKASEKAARTWGPGVGIVDQLGQPFPALPPVSRGNGYHAGGGGGSDLGARVGTLESEVGTLKKQLGTMFILGLAAITGLFFILDDRIDDRFDRMDSRMEKTAEGIAAANLLAAREFERLLAGLADDRGPKERRK